MPIDGRFLSALCGEVPTGLRRCDVGFGAYEQCAGTDWYGSGGFCRLANSSGIARLTRHPSGVDSRVMAQHVEPAHTGGCPDIWRYGRTVSAFTATMSVFGDR